MRNTTTKTMTSILIAAVVCGCSPTEEGPVDTLRAADAPDEVELPEEAPVIEKIRAARAAYLALDQPAYRTQLFHLLGGLGPEDGVQSFIWLADVTLAEGAEGGFDGLGPILLYAADGIAQYGSEADKQAFAQQLEETTPEYAVGSPNSAFIAPLGRSFSSVFVDVRADAMRTLTNGMFDYGGLPGTGLDGLLELDSILEDLCDLPQREGHDRGVAVSNFQTALDIQRTDACGSSGRPGGGNSGGLPGGLGNIAEGACFDPTVDIGKTDPTAQQFADLMACANSMNPDNSRWGPGNVSSGVGIIGAAIGLGVFIIEHHAEQMDQVRDAYADASAAWTEAKIAGEEYVDARDDLDEANQELETAREDSEYATTEEGQALAQERIAEAEKDVEKAEENLENAERNLDAAVTRANEKQQHAEKVAKQNGVTTPGTEGQSTPECEAAFNNMFEGTQWERDFDEAVQHGRENGVDPRVANWSSDSDFGVDGLGMTGCGIDGNTISPGQQACQGLVLCDEMDAHCSCNSDGPSQSELAQLRGMAAMGCAAVINCEGSPPEMSDLGCTCNGGDQNVDLDGIGPDVTGPTGRFLQATFSDIGALAGMDLSTTERAMTGALRDDVGVGEVMQPDFGQ